MGGPLPPSIPWYCTGTPVGINDNKSYKGYKQICTLHSYLSHKHTNRHKDAQPCITVAPDTLHDFTKFQP